MGWLITMIVSAAVAGSLAFAVMFVATRLLTADASAWQIRAVCLTLSLGVVFVTTFVIRHFQTGIPQSTFYSVILAAVIGAESQIRRRSEPRRRSVE